MDFGFSGLNKRTSQVNGLLNFDPKNVFTPVRVISIILDENHPRFKELGEWNGLGIIEFESIDNPTEGVVSLPIASPLLPNIKNYPLKNELVYIINLPDTNLNKTTVSKKSYYINVISLWNHPHHNAYPSSPDNLPDSQKKDYIETQAGSVRKVTDNSTEINLGNTFKERNNIHPILPFEGDVIHEGRWGNSIRLGSTVKNKNTWSNSGDNGDPITIIRNGQPKDSTQEGWVPIIEDINKDISSIYCTSTQQIPLKKSSDIAFNSYKTQPIAFNEYKEEQIILNSGRLVFNSNKDHILFSSLKSIGLNAKESINIDSPNTIVKSDKVLLGDKEAKQSLILGDKFLDDFNSLLSDIKLLSNSLQNLVGLPSGTPYVTLTAPTTKLSLTIGKLQNSIEDYKSKISYTK